LSIAGGDITSPLYRSKEKTRLVSKSRANTRLEKDVDWLDGRGFTKMHDHSRRAERDLGAEPKDDLCPFGEEPAPFDDRVGGGEPSRLMNG
jgi:hypothetical protein